MIPFQTKFCVNNVFQKKKTIKHFCALLLYITTEYPNVKRNYFVKSNTVALHSFNNLQYCHFICPLSA